MSPLEIMEARQQELQASIESLYNQRGAMIDAAAAEKRALSDNEQATFDELGTKRAAAEKELGPVTERVTELREQAKREAAAAASRVESGATGEQRTAARVTDAPIYAKGNVERSYFRDLFNAQHRGDVAASERLRRNDAMVRETRALTTTAGAGGEFAPPLWLVSEFVALARAGRKFADSVGAKNLPSGISSVNLPKVATGTTTAIQATQNSALSQTDLTTSSVSSGIATIGGKQVVAMQLLEQSGIPFDEVVLDDLARDYAKQYDTQAISGSGASGQMEGVHTYFAASGTVNVTFTSASPAVASTTTANSFYSKVMGAVSSIATTRFMDADTIWMHPRRWAWILAAVDSNSRPLVLPNASTAFNPIAVENGVITEGYAGQLGGLQVITDANIPTNTGAGTNQDPVLVGVRSDLRLYESELRMETFTATYADSAGVLFRALAYGAAIPSRYDSSVSVINGTGLVAPTF